MNRHSDNSRQNSLRWRVVVVCFLVQNVAMAMAFGTFGPMLASTEEHFGVSRAVAATGMSFITLAIGGLSPLLGSLLQRVPVRSAMISAALLSSVGYCGLAFVNPFQLALLMYGLIGTGVCLLGILGPLVLINRWFETNRAKVLSLVNLPIALFVTPYIVATFLPIYGRFAIFCVIATIFLLIIPLLFSLVERPVMAANPANPVDRVDVRKPELSKDSRSISRNPAFWLVSLGIGVIAGAGIAFVVHIVPFGMDRNLSLPAASALLSVYSGCGIFGTLLLGWLADRIGPPTTLVIAAAAMSGLWWSLLHITGVPLYVVAALIGVFGVPVVTLHGAALSEIFGVDRISRAMGCSYLIKLPFIFTFAPVVGLLFDRSGGYQLPFLFIVGLLAVAAVCFYAVRELRSVRAGPTL
jgi:MFS family permease